MASDEHRAAKPAKAYLFRGNLLTPSGDFLDTTNISCVSNETPVLSPEKHLSEEKVEKPPQLSFEDRVRQLLAVYILALAFVAFSPMMFRCREMKRRRGRC